MATPTATLTYATASTVAPDGHVHLSAAQDGVHLDGELTRPVVSARSLLAVAAVARARYYEPPGMVRARILAADPVVTCAEERLRFESFSRCGGVHCRYDVLPEGFTARSVRFGTTNVDLNPHTRAALAAVDDRSPLALEVGDDGVTVRTGTDEAVEHRVPLPERWIRGFAEVQVAAARLVLRHQLGRTPAVRFIRALPTTTSRGAPTWVVPSADGLRLTRTPTDDAVCLAGPERLAEIRALAPLVTGLRVYGPPPTTRAGHGDTGRGRAAEPSAWEFTLDGGRLTFALSPQVERGFSGEGAVLEALVAADPDLADRIGGLLGDGSAIDDVALAQEVGRSRTEVRAALDELAAHGRLGYDLADASHYARDLPLGRELLERSHPRLRDARALVAEGAVAIEGQAGRVWTEEAVHTVRLGADGASCTCPWYAKHRGERGPCKHVLAVQIVARREVPTERPT